MNEATSNNHDPSFSLAEYACQIAFALARTASSGSRLDRELADIQAMPEHIADLILEHFVESGIARRTGPGRSDHELAGMPDAIPLSSILQAIDAISTQRACEVMSLDGNQSAKTIGSPADMETDQICDITIGQLIAIGRMW
jgi:hypothetical protein